MAGFVHPPRWHHRLHARATDLQPQTVLATLDDHELVQRCRQGEQAAWAVLVRRFQRLVYTVPRTAGLPEEQAADVFQFSFQRLHQNLHRLEDPSRVRAWLVTTAKRETLRLLSENRRYASSAPAGASADDGDDIDRRRCPTPRRCKTPSSTRCSSSTACAPPWTSWTPPHASWWSCFSWKKSRCPMPRSRAGCRCPRAA
jgi:Sigma-70 region 2